MSKQANANEERNIRQVIKDNAMTLVWVAGVVFSFIMFVVIPQQESAKNIALIQQSIDTINTNHMTHLQDFGDELTDLSKVQAEQAKVQTELMKDLTVISTRLEDHIDNTK